MDEKEKLIAQVTEKAKKEAKKQNLNEVQTELFVEEEVHKALEEFDAKTEIDKEPVAQKNDIKSKNSKKGSKYIVHTPVPNYCGEVAGVQFAYGKAEVKPGWILNWFIERGYKVEEVSE